LPHSSAVLSRRTSHSGHRYLAEVREILFKEVLDMGDVEALRPPRLDLADVLLAHQVVGRHAAKGLQDLVPDIFRHSLEIFVLREVHQVARDLLKSLFDRGRLESEAEGRAARCATRRVREPGRAAHRAAGSAHRALRSRHEVGE